MMLNNFLFKKIDNSALIVFRVFFGLLIFLESVGAIFTGWVKRTLVDPQFTFSFIGLEWLQPLPGNGMYFYFAIMAVFGFLIMLGYKYRWSMLVFAILWAGVYFMQKASYNNHYYLLMILSFVMVLVPANGYLSLDVKQNAEQKKSYFYNWQKWLIVGLMSIAYIFGGINKIYPDWLRAIPVQQFMVGKQHYFLIGDILQERWVHYALSYLGMLFDGLIVFALLYKPTRKIAFIIAMFFHAFNAIIFQVGIFPFLSLAFCLFFFEEKLIRNIFLKTKKLHKETSLEIPKYANVIKWGFVIFMIIQVALPLRHWFIKDNVLWTEEGHRLSWRMMLRAKSGIINYEVVDKATGKSKIINYRKMVSPKQAGMLSTKPDVIWQFVQRLKEKYKAEGKTIEVYATHSKLSVNGKKYYPFINPKIDLASVKWDFFKHSNWILPSPNYNEKLKTTNNRIR